MGWFKVTETVLDILDLVDCDPDVDALVSICIQSTDVNRIAQIVIIALNNLNFVSLP